jgi:hypothetical protein
MHITAAMAEQNISSECKKVDITAQKNTAIAVFTARNPIL